MPSEFVRKLLCETEMIIKESFSSYHKSNSAEHERGYMEERHMM